MTMMQQLKFLLLSAQFDRAGPRPGPRSDTPSRNQLSRARNNISNVAMGAAEVPRCRAGRRTRARWPRRHWQ